MKTRRPTTVLEDNNANIGCNGSTFVPAQQTTVAPPNAHLHIAFVVANADVPTLSTTVITDAVAAALSAIYVLNSVPTLLPPLAPTDMEVQDDSSMNLDGIENYDGSLKMLTGEDGDTKMPANNSKPNQQRGNQIKFKDQGILAQSSLYLKPKVDKEVATEHCAVDHYMKGVILEIPSKKNGNCYKVARDVLGCMIAIEQPDLCTTFFKTDNMFSVMKLVRKKYDKFYLSLPTFHLKKTKKKTDEKSPSTPGQTKMKMKNKAIKKKKNTTDTPKEKGNKETTDITMTPIPSHTVLGEDSSAAAIVSEVDVESESDDGSDIDDADCTFLPREYLIDENDDVLPDDGYNPKLMEEDGEYGGACVEL